jgi:hypothetical protein
VVPDASSLMASDAAPPTVPNASTPPAPNAGSADGAERRFRRWHRTPVPPLIPDAEVGGSGSVVQLRTIPLVAGSRTGALVLLREAPPTVRARRATA